MQQPHAVIALPNNVEIDARAHRNGLALVAAGYRVTMVGYGTGIPPAGEISGMPYLLTFHPPTVKNLSLVYRVVRKGFHVAAKRRPPQQVLKAVAKVDAVTDGVKGAFRSLKKKVLPAPPAGAAPEPTTWEGMLPHIAAMEAAMQPTLVQLKPDLIMCDVHLLPVASRVADHFRTQGHKTAVVYDAREYVYGLASENPHVLKGFPLLESEYIGRCDAVVTVCDPIADFLQDKYDLTVRPQLVPNAPIRELPAAGKPLTIRDFLDVGDAPLLAYAGGLSEHRGVHHVIEALPELAEVHFAIGARRPSSYTLELENLADRLGVRDRVHFVPFAPAHEVADYLSSATAAIFPFLPVGNHVWAAPNKYFESVQARLPILTSNMEWLEAQVTRLGIGEVFEHSNPASIATATRTLLADLDRYRTNITDEVVAEHSFEHFVPTVQEVCLDVTSERVRRGLDPSSLASNLTALRKDMLGLRVPLADSELFEPRPWLRIGTSNSAGLPRVWGQALMRDYPRAIAESVWMLRNGGLAFPVDETFTHQQAVTPAYQRALKSKYEDRVTHVLSESGRPMVGLAFGSYFWQESDWFKQRGIRQGLVFHGSDIRNPRRHAELEPDSPYANPQDEQLAELTAALQSQVETLMPHVQAFDGPVHVTTMDLMDHVPDAIWLPLAVDAADWESQVVPLASDDPPVVLHIPSKAGLKGSDVVDEVCQQLQADGRIRYVRRDGLTREQVRELVLGADVVVDQLRIGDYGVTAVEAMSAGKVVIGHIADRVLERYPEAPPILRATCTTLADVMEDLLQHPERGAEIGAASRDYARRWHHGSESARVLAEFMEL